MAVGAAVDFPVYGSSDMAGGVERCGENLRVCTANANLGPDGIETRATYNDVDDYLNIALENSFEEDLSGLYQGFSIAVNVCNDSDYDGECEAGENNETAKLITISVTDPLNNTIDFSSYKANF